MRLFAVSAVICLAAFSPQASAVPFTITNLSNNRFNDSNPQVSGSNVVWYGFDGNDDEMISSK